MKACIIVFGQYKIGNGDFELHDIIAPFDDMSFAALHVQNVIGATETSVKWTYYSAGGCGDTRFKYVVKQMTAPAIKRNEESMSMKLNWTKIEDMSHALLGDGRWLRIRSYRWGVKHESMRLELLTEHGWDNIHDIPYAYEDFPITTKFGKNMEEARDIATSRCQQYATAIYEV